MGWGQLSRPPEAASQLNRWVQTQRVISGMWLLAGMKKRPEGYGEEGKRTDTVWRGEETIFFEDNRQ